MRWRWAIVPCAAWTRDAAACVYIGNGSFMPAETPTERIVPSPPVMSQAEVSVYRDPEGCNAPNDDCGSIGHIYFDVRASDDTTPTDQLGYRLRVRRGIGPGILDLDRDLLASDGSIVLLFGVQDEPVDFDIDLGVTVIDLSGNLGQEQIVRITYSEDSGGCVTTRTPSPLSKLAIVCLTAGLLFRRRQRVA